MKFTFGLIALLSMTLPAISMAQKKAPVKPPIKPQVKNQDISRSQGQLQGGDGLFGSIYTLNSGWNFTVLRARYTVDPYLSYEGMFPAPDSKLLILSIAIKNSDPADKFFGGPEFQAFDEEGHDYAGGDYRLASLGSKQNSVSLKPGQGVGQTPDKDEFTIAFNVPDKARISKIILKDGRKFVKDEKVVRYFINDVATKERDGQPGNPKNIVTPLPEFLRDPADKLGATPLAIAPTKLSTVVPTGYYAVSIDSVALSATEKVKDQAPAEGKQYAIVTMTVKNNWSKAMGLFDLLSEETTVLKDTDGEKYTVIESTYKRKAKRDEAITDGLELQPGETYTYRHFYEVPKDVKLKSITFGQKSSRKYSIDL
ncbi:MAG: hypothetical protein JWN14_2997 [Chthonomonadales bacterium]|nr:hypothetical protein [Chthonomonadales bacterium]